MHDFIEPTTDYSDADLVVDWPHTDLVRQKLDSPAIRDLVRLDDVDDARKDLGLTRFQLSRVSDTVTDNEVIERVLEALRLEFQRSHDGWVPEMDGNPTLTGVVGYPHTKPMAFTSDLATATAEEFGPIPDRGPGTDVRVATLDTRLINHPQLVGHAHAAPTDPPGPAVADAAWAGHGTFVAGLIAKEAPGCEIVVHGVLDNEGRASVWDTALALARLADETTPYDVINLSLGCRLGGPAGPLALRRAVQRHAGRSLLVAAAGNHGTVASVPAWPAAFPVVIAVGATHLHNGHREVSEITPQLPYVDCVALGSGVTSTYIEGDFEVTDVTGEPTTKPLHFEKYATWSGTSFAAAKVTGAVAAARLPGESPAETYRRLLDAPGSGVSRPPW